MQKFNKYGEYVLYAGTGFLLFLVLFQNLLQIPSWLEIAGRMHPMFLHFPVVLLLLAFLSLWIPSKKETNVWMDTLRLIAALSAVLTAAMGMLLSLEQSGSGNILQLHKWMGVGVAVAGFLFYNYYTFFHKRIKTGKLFTLIAVGIIILAGHFGAELTHGENYLLEPITRVSAKSVDPDEAHIYQDVIKPILDENCKNCHGNASRKGDLRLDDTTGILAGGKTGPLFVAGDADMSLLIQRIHLPESDKKRMPPRSEPQLTYDEVVLLRAWINAGAHMNTRLSELKDKDTFRLLATRYLGPLSGAGNIVHYDFGAADEKKIESLSNNYRVIEPQGIGSPALAVSFFGKYAYTTKSLEELLPLKQQIIELNLARMPVKDEDLGVVKQITNLRKLNLNLTDITSKGLEQLSGLKHLSDIALSGTAIDVQGLEKILGLPALSSVFVWDTKIDSTQLVAVRSKFKKVTIHTGYTDDGSTVFELGSPVIQAAAGIFDKNIKIEVKHPFKDAVIRYSLDGTPPDSVNGPIYKEPVKLDSSATFIARAFKDGWYGSKPATASFIKRGQVPDSIELGSRPDPKYTGSIALLQDGDFGDTNFGDGKWLGYQQNSADFFLYFDQETSVRQILLNVLTQTGSYIFPPEKIEVWGGMEKNNLKLLGKLLPEIPSKNEASRLLQKKVTFGPTQVKALKIVVTPVRKLPGWHEGKGKPGWAFLNEIVVQ